MSTERIAIRSNQILFNASGATGVSEVINVADFDNIIVAVSAALNSTLTFKFQGSMGAGIGDAGKPVAPDFSAAQSVTNMWDYVSAYDLNDPSSVITGDTGVSLNNDTVANNTRMYIINTSLLRFFSMQISAWTDGSLTAIVGTSTI